MDSKIFIKDGSPEKMVPYSYRVSPMMHGYFNIGNVSGHIKSDTSLSMCKFHVHEYDASLLCPCCIVSGDHRVSLVTVLLID